MDIDDKICTLHGAINYFGEETDGKNKNALRSYVIPQIAIDILDEQKQMLKKFGVISPFVFPALNGQAAKQITYYKHWAVYRDYNGISKRTPYEMRHTFFSANKALPKELLKAMGGHGKDFDTFGTYGHSMNGESQRIADMVNKTYIDILEKRG